MFHYIRSNQDGSSPEHIYVYRRDAEHLEVGKSVDPCTNAAFVTASIDPVRGHPLSLVGGRLARDLSQEPFAWLSYDPASGDIHMRVPAANIDDTAQIGGEPWLMYDFDLAELNGFFAGRAAPREDFRYAVGLLMETDSGWGFVNRGAAFAQYAGAERHHGRMSVRFDVTGALTGRLWLDEQHGFIVQAEFDEPNHAGYDSFRLVLQDVSEDGASAWEAARRAHWEGCD